MSFLGQLIVGLKLPEVAKRHPKPDWYTFNIFILYILCLFCLLKWLEFYQPGSSKRPRFGRNCCDLFRAKLFLWPPFGGIKRSRLEEAGSWISFWNPQTWCLVFGSFLRRHFGGLHFARWLKSPGAKGVETKLREEEAGDFHFGRVRGEILHCWGGYKMGPPNYYKWIYPYSYTYLQPWLTRVCWAYNYLYN